MKHIITLFLLVFAFTTASAQKIISHTTVICKVSDNHIDQVDYTDGHTVYEIWFNRNNNRIAQSICVQYSSKEKMVQVLNFLFNFDKGEGYYIDLESNNHATVISSTRKSFFLSSGTDVDKFFINHYIIGKLLNGLGEGVKVSDDDNTPEKPKSDDGVY